jgi:hypothetical protein
MKKDVVFHEIDRRKPAGGGEKAVSDHTTCVVGRLRILDTRLGATRERPRRHFYGGRRNEWGGAGGGYTVARCGDGATSDAWVPKLGSFGP